MWSTWNTLGGVRAGRPFSARSSEGTELCIQEEHRDQMPPEGPGGRRFGYSTADKDVAESAASRRKAEGEYSEYFFFEYFFTIPNFNEETHFFFNSNIGKEAMCKSCEF